MHYFLSFTKKSILAKPYKASLNFYRAEAKSKIESCFDGKNNGEDTLAVLIDLL